MLSLSVNVRLQATRVPPNVNLPYGLTLRARMLMQSKPRPVYPMPAARKQRNSTAKAGAMCASCTQA